MLIKYILMVQGEDRVIIWNLTIFSHKISFLLYKFSIPAFQHRVFSRLSIFSFKILNFSMSPKVLREDILENFEKQNETESSTSDKPESVRVLINRIVIISPDTPITH